jgi:glycosyltransferase involved in cell wall biosynthesis
MRMDAASVIPHDPIPTIDFAAHLARPLRVRWEGELALASARARFNREVCRGLIAPGDVALSVADPAAALAGLEDAEAAPFAPVLACRGARSEFPFDVTVRHSLMPDWRRPETRRLVMVAPWPYAHLPREWRDGALAAADEIWAPSRSARDTYVRSGIPAEKVRLVPPGVNADCFTPEGDPFPLPTEKSVRFLFVGDLSYRRGADLLLGAYTRAFGPDDDVCLVVKVAPGSRLHAPGWGPGFVEPGAASEASYREAAADPRLPEILFVEEALADAELAALYRGCTCVVLPARGLAYGMPVREGLACGRPALVTAGLATDDVLDETMGWRVPSRRLPAPRSRLAAGSGGGETVWTVGAYECAGEPWLLEPEREALVETLREIAARPDEARARGQAARAHIAAHGTWEQTAAQIRYRLQEIVAPSGDPPFVAPKPWFDPQAVPAQNLNGGDANHEDTKDTKTHAAIPGGDGGVPSSDDVVSSSCSSCLRGSTTDTFPIEISLCMIVRDEEPRLPHCLASLAPFVDEMVIVDTGSTDRTREVARDFGARVFDFPWVDSFSVARNQSIELARGRWILRMDADDVIAPEDAAKLKDLVRRYAGRSDVAYLMEYRVPPGPDGSGGHVVDQVQLWPNRPDLRFEYRLHEQLLPAVLRARMYTLKSGIAVHHCNFDWSENGRAKRRRRDFPLLEKDLQEHPNDPFVLFNLGMTWLNSLQEHEVAAHYLRRGLLASGGRHGIDRLIYRYLFRARIAQEEGELALAANEEGRRRFPEDADLLLQAAELYETLGRTQEAWAALDRLVLGYDEPQYRCADSGLRTYRGRTERARFLRRQGHVEWAESLLREVTTHYPFYQPARAELAETLRTLGRGDEAEALLTPPAHDARPPIPVPLPPRHLRARPVSLDHRSAAVPPRRSVGAGIRVAHATPVMGIGGTEHVILDLCRFGSEAAFVVATEDGPMRPVFEEAGIEVHVARSVAEAARLLAEADVVNVHWMEFLPNLFRAVLDAGRPMVSTLHWPSVLPPMPGPVLCNAGHVYDLQEPNADRRTLILQAIDTQRYGRQPLPLSQNWERAGYPRAKRVGGGGEGGSPRGPWGESGRSPGGPGSEGRPLGRNDGERVRILRVCRPQRCADYFWPGIYQALSACPAADVAVVGGPPMEAERLRCLGVRLDVEQVLAEADLFAYTPRREEGTLDRVILEAMASGLPWVLSDVECTREAVEPEVTGLLTPYEDVPAFAAALVRLVRERELREAMGERAAAAARERFEIRDRMPLYTDAYRRAREEAILPARQSEFRERVLVRSS